MYFAFQNKVNSRNQNLINEIRVNFENKMLKDVWNTQMGDGAFQNLFMNSNELL